MKLLEKVASKIPPLDWIVEQYKYRTRFNPDQLREYLTDEGFRQSKIGDREVWSGGSANPSGVIFYPKSRGRLEVLASQAQYVDSDFLEKVEGIYFEHTKRNLRSTLVSMGLLAIYFVCRVSTWQETGFSLNAFDYLIGVSAGFGMLMIGHGMFPRTLVNCKDVVYCGSEALKFLKYEEKVSG